MKLSNFRLKILCSFFIFCMPFLFGQEIENKVKYDFNKIDQYLIENHEIEYSNISLNILFSSNDCKMCVSYLQNVLPKESDIENLSINIFTDNIIYAKKHLNKYNLKLNYFYEDSIFSLFNIESKTIIYLKEEEKITSTLNDIIINLNKKDYITLRVIDSLLTSDNISSTLLPYKKILTYDSKMETAILIEKEGKSKEFSKIHYLYPKVNDSVKLYNLDERIANKSKHQKIDYDSFEKMLIDNSLRYIEVQSFSSFQNTIYCTFIINRLYKDLEIKDNFGLIGNSFIASKKIKSEDDIMNIMDISSYDNYYLIDLFNFNNTTFPLSIYVYDNFKVLDENVIKIKVNKQIPGQHELAFGGEITFILNPLSNSTQATELDENVQKSFNRNNTVYIDDYKYTIEKK